ncbi:hypothetical protein [Bifidobacterium biavatii]|uniref:56B-like ribbon-helix-helix domain-containing protein n=1 Tax=Bifidobacterium biavatii DSM 23969 TaxID=1437608 RepID=A0A086ZD96_9BIFI|nr:hypothetical protein [Bifidobacterium biavatii]KFI44496.1 hypothetical protein BBIA_2404 [Bifidobacterium biavatii DSM 23969]
MKNNNFKPTASSLRVESAKDVFRTDRDPDAEPTVNTSMKLLVETRNRLKLYAAAHGLKMQDVVEDAINEYLERMGG